MVEKAITFFKSFCTKPIVAAKIAVVTPTIIISNKVLGAYSNKGEQRIIKKTPADSLNVKPFALK